MGLDPNVILRMILSDMDREQGQAQQAAQEQERFLTQLGLSVAQQGGNVEKVIGDGLPRSRVQALQELSKLTKQQQKTQEVVQSPAAGAAATPSAGPGRESVLDSLRMVERGVAGRSSAPSEPFDPETLSAFSQIETAAASNVAGAQQQQATRRQEIADAGRKEFIDTMAGLVALNPDDPGLAASVAEMVSQQFPEAADEVMRSVSASAAFQAQTGVGGTQSERFISLLPIGQRSAARAGLIQQRISPTISQRTPINLSKALEIAEQDDRATSGLEIGTRILQTIQQDPAATGFGARVRGAIQGAGEVVSGIDSVLGTGAFARFQDFGIDRLASLPPNQQSSDAALQLMDILTNPNAHEVDFGNLMLSFLLESSVTGGRRFSIQAVKLILKNIEGGATRPPAATARVLESALRKLLRDTERGRRRIRAVDPGLYKILEPTLDPLPTIERKGAEPDFVFDPSTGIVPAGEVR